SSVMAQMIEAPTHNFNVTSPITNGPYVVNQILPCTIRVFSNVDTSRLDLAIRLEMVGGGMVAPPPPPPAAASSTGSNSTTNGTSTSPPAASATTPAANGTYVISDHADVSKTDAYLKQEGNLTYYEHWINYQIPLNVQPGQYKVIFNDRSTNSNLAIPIEIRPASPTPSKGASPSGFDGSGSSGSIFSGNAPAALPAPRLVMATCSVAL
ncbi:hypothetical protein BC940DRAFT_223268, partial [Gongronella butleri]